MAAADYFTQSLNPSSDHHAGAYPPPRPYRASSHPGYVYRPSSASPSQPSPQPQPYQQQQQHAAFAPPPYQSVTPDQKPSVHFAPTPSPLAQYRPTAANASRPDGQQPSMPPYHYHNHAQYLAPPQPGTYPPPGGGNAYYPPSYQYPPYPNHPGRVHRDGDGNGYTSDPEYHRRKQKSRQRRISENSRSTNADGFIGAAGGGLIGDLLFPGLGTVGGALVGWVGGKDYGKHRKWREDKRDRDQERWERKYGADRDRSRSSSRDRRRNSRDRRKSRE